MMILWDITSNFVRGTLAKKIKIAAKLSELGLRYHFLKDANIGEHDSFTKQRGMFVDVIVAYCKLIRRKT